MNKQLAALTVIVGMVLILLIIHVEAADFRVFEENCG